MAEKQQAHRHDIDQTAVQASIDTEKRGQDYASCYPCWLLRDQCSLFIMATKLLAACSPGDRCLALLISSLPAEKQSSQRVTIRIVRPRKILSQDCSAHMPSPNLPYPNIRQGHPPQKLPPNRSRALTHQVNWIPTCKKLSKLIRDQWVFS